MKNTAKEARDFMVRTGLPFTSIPVPAEKPKWFVFMAGEEDEYSVTRHPSYAKAVWEAQCRGCTEKRPKRLHAGFYELSGCSGKTMYFIATAEAMERQGYGDLTVLR